MLRESIATFGRALTPAPITSGVGDPGVADGAAIIAFVDSVVLLDQWEIDTAREDLVARIGPAATDRVAMVAGNFSMMNRALDAIGAPVGRGHDELAAEMGVSIPEHLAPR